MCCDGLARSARSCRLGELGLDKGVGAGLINGKRLWISWIDKKSKLLIYRKWMAENIQQIARHFVVYAAVVPVFNPQFVHPVAPDDFTHCAGDLLALFDQIFLSPVILPIHQEKPEGYGHKKQDQPGWRHGTQRGQPKLGEQQASQNNEKRAGDKDAGGCWFCPDGAERFGSGGHKLIECVWA